LPPWSHTEALRKTPTSAACCPPGTRVKIALGMRAGQAMAALRRRLGQVQRGSLRHFATPCEACSSYACGGAWCGDCCEGGAAGFRGCLT